MGIIIISTLQVRKQRHWLIEIYLVPHSLLLKTTSAIFACLLAIPLSSSINILIWASLVAQWLMVCLPVQRTRVQALVQEDPTCHEATRPVRHSYWACALEPASHNYWVCVPQLLKPVRLEPVLRNKRSHCDEKPSHCNEEKPLLASTRESPCSNEDRTQSKIK